MQHKELPRRGRARSDLCYCLLTAAICRVAADYLLGHVGVSVDSVHNQFL